MRNKSVPGKQNRHLPAFLLLFLTEGDAHGGMLWNRVSDLMPVHWEIDSGAVYRVLRDMEDRGSVTSYWNTNDAGPAKRIYKITPLGVDELKLWYVDILQRKKNLEYFISQYESTNQNSKPDVGVE